MNKPINTPKPISLIQISDSHLFAEPTALHVGQPVYQNLQRIFAQVAGLNDIDAIIFTGDLSQDHSQASYLHFVELFAQAVKEHSLNMPLYWLPGNHDELNNLNHLLLHPLIKADKQLTLGDWQLQLLNSKSANPSGIISKAQQEMVSAKLSEAKYNVFFMHHPPLDVGYFIDRHGLQQKDDFWQFVNNEPSVQAIFCGHVHRSITIKASKERAADVYTCPATSVQFDPDAPGLAGLAQGPGYRVIKLHSDGGIETFVDYLENEGESP